MPPATDVARPGGALRNSRWKHCSTSALDRPSGAWMRRMRFPRVPLRFTLGYFRSALAGHLFLSSTRIFSQEKTLTAETYFAVR